ncbi:MAG: tRNA epoxyqueuosine(34) reductase QueG [Bacteroidales bacterium]|nr:tRNA epoxyqueuosine(34) reductase QueG [Bacteroidales bacterium]
MISSADVKRAAAEAGFDACGVARAAALGGAGATLRQWLDEGRHAGLGYMERNVDMRLDPRLLVPGAKSVVSVALGYNPSRLMQGPGRVARYAYGDDYHDTIRSMLHRMKDALGIEAKVCCDTAPISDKHWAAQAGLGWIGRHTLLVTPDWGSWVNLGELVTTEECDHYDTPAAAPCQACHRCVDACPNHALAASGPPTIDLRRCTAYHTIESRADDLPPSLVTAGYAFGCDLCQQACPHNTRPGLRTREVDASRIATLESMGSMDEQAFRKAVKHTSMSRIKYPQWQRNLNRAAPHGGGENSAPGSE